MKLTKLFIGITLLISLFLVPYEILGQDQGNLKESIIKRAWGAMYGDINPEDLHTIYFESYFHGREIPGKIYIRRPDKFRNESDDITLIFDGERAVIIDNLKLRNGEAGGLEFVDSAYLSHFEVDIALAFPAFFEYPSKYLGTVQIGTAQCWELYVELPRGGKVTYFIDTSSYLVSRRLVSWDGNSDKEPWENIISGYNSYNGILFESGYSFIGHEGQEEGFLRNVSFNTEFQDRLFSIPEE